MLCRQVNYKIPGTILDHSFMETIFKNLFTVLIMNPKNENYEFCKLHTTAEHTLETIKNTEKKMCMFALQMQIFMQNQLKNE